MEMRRPAGSVSTTICLGILVGAMLSTSGAAAADESMSLDGRMTGISNFGAPECESATGVCSRFTSTGSITGEGVVSVDSFPTPDGISKAHTVIHTSEGDLSCSEAAIFDLTPGSDHAFVDLCIIEGGTGRYAGASGYIQEFGTFDFEANVGEARYVGRLILPEPFSSSSPNPD